MWCNDLVVGCVMVIYILIVVECLGVLEIWVLIIIGYDNKFCLFLSVLGFCKMVGFVLNVMEDEENYN